MGSALRRHSAVVVASALLAAGGIAAPSTAAATAAADSRNLASAPAQAPVQCPAVTFADYPRRDPSGQFFANTAFQWTLHNHRFNVTFDRANSWVRPNAAGNQQLERHEQYHLKLACAIADIANGMLARGDDERTVTGQLRNTLTVATQMYDAATNHGTLTLQQALMEQAIDAGQVMMTPPTP